MTPGTLALAVLAVVIATAASLYRQGPIPAWDTIWAEDGRVSLGDAVDESFGAALSTPVSGYYNTLPRVLAEPVSWLPVEHAAAAIAVEAALVTSLFALFVYVASGAHLRTPLARLAAAAVAVVPPVGMHEVPNALCNLHWPGLYAAVWALLYLPRGRLGLLVSCALLFCVAVTNPIAVVLAPLALLRLLLRPREGGMLLGALAIGLLPHAMGAFMGAAASRTIPTQPDPSGALAYFFTHAVPLSLLGEVLGPHRIYGTPLDRGLIATGAWAAILVATGLAARLARPNLAVAVVLAIQAFVFWMVAAGATGHRVPRYEATVAMMITGALVALFLPGPAGTRRGPLAGLALALAIVWCVNFRVPTERGVGPRWSAAVARARADCAQPGVVRVQLPISPATWSVSLPCSYVGR